MRLGRCLSGLLICAIAGIKALGQSVHPGANTSYGMEQLAFIWDDHAGSAGEGEYGLDGYTPEASMADLAPGLGDCSVIRLIFNMDEPANVAMHSNAGLCSLDIDSKGKRRWPC